ncbi:MAG TPA: NAD-dependent epimerase/dehydratase family protein [Aggregatilineales bacterium]|nr:NAD-dependent epimerase/dehydratase family protein [Anaerolineales bacterium]HRE49561.1 NAD-dependent epimerase/dehydratase family protein [Aggregatilineales bacterium]
MKTALVTGANGFLGSVLVRRLRREGISVRALCRDPHKGDHLAALGAEVIRGDIQLPATLETPMRGCDVVFHAAAVHSSAATSYNVNVIGTQNVVTAARTAKVGRLVHVSSVAVYGYHIAGDVTEETPMRPSPNDYYTQSKALGEQVLWHEARRGGLPTVSIRPAFIYGEGSAFWSRGLYRLVATRRAPMVNQGRGNAHPIFVEDVVDLLITSATHPNAPGNAFNAAPDPAPTWADYLGHYARIAGKDTSKAYVNLPPAAALLAALIGGITRLRGVPTDAAGMLHYIGTRATYRMTHAAERLGWRPRYSLVEGMAAQETWLRGLSLV